MQKISFFTPLVWVIIACLGFILLPVFALDYGLFGSTRAELLAAMGWHGANISWAWFLPLFAFFWPNPTACRRRAKWELLGLAVWFGFVIGSAVWLEVKLGYALLPLLAAMLVLATNHLATLQLMRGDRFIIAVLLVILLLIFTFIVYPIGSMLLSMFYQNGEFAPSQALNALRQPYLLQVVQNSLAVAFTVGIFSTLFGLAFALYTTRIAERSRFLGRLLSILPIVTPPFVVGLGVTLMLGRAGYLTAFLVEWFGISRNWLYGFNGIVIAHTLALTPMSFMILEGALKALSPTLEEAAYSQRASRLQVFFSVILPLLKPALANSFLVVAIQSLADFSTPLVLGGSFDVIASQIYFAVAGSQLDYVSAGTLGTLLLLFSLVIFVVQYLWIGKRSYVTVAGKGVKSPSQPLPRQVRYVVITAMLLWGGFNLVLYGSIFYGSFTLNWGVDHTLTLENYRRLFGQGFSEGGFPSLIQTVIFAACAAPITAIFGLLIAYLTVCRQFKGKKTLEFLTLLCFAVPGTVAGLAYVLAFNNAPLYLTGTGVIIVLSMVMRNMPIGMRAAVAGLNQLDKSLDEASLSLKAGSFKTLLFVVLPLLKPALLSALVTSFVRAMTTVSAIVFLVTADTRVATSYILNRVEDGEYGIAIAYGSLLIVVMLAVILLFDRLVGDMPFQSAIRKKNAA